MLRRVAKSLLMVLVVLSLATVGCGSTDDAPSVDEDYSSAESEGGSTGSSGGTGGSGSGTTSGTSAGGSTSGTTGGQGHAGRTSGGTTGGVASGGSTGGTGSGGTTGGSSGTAGGGAEPGGGGENYEETKENEFVDASQENTSTFSIDVDTGSYTLMRDDIERGRLPDERGVRTEEYINFFDYGYAPPQTEDQPFSIHTEAAPSHFGKEKKLMRVGLQGREIPVDQLRPVTLVFLIDASGSMSASNKLPAVKTAMRTLVDHLRPSDRVGLVVYAGSQRPVLQPTKVSKKSKIINAVNGLTASGGTNGEAGIQQAYKMAEQYKQKNGINRVILCTDGDFNVGKTGDALVEMVKDYRKKQISLTTVGFGRGNYNDAVMEKLARDGNGNYFYVDSQKEAKRIFGAELASTLEVIAADVKIQVEFNAKVVDRYRLVGYENRVLDNEDFDDDTKDAGEIGPGHTVTAYYELEMTRSAVQQTDSTPLSTVRLRYKDAYGEQSKKIEEALQMGSLQDDFTKASDGFQFGAAVAEYAEILGQSKHSTGARFGDVLTIAKRTSRQQRAERLEFIELVKKAKKLWP